MNWKIQYWEGVNSPKTDIQIQCNLNKNLGRIVIFYQVAYLKLIEDQGTKVTETVLEKKNKVRGVIVPDFKS